MIDNEKVMVLRSCSLDGTAHGGFQWPTTVGAVVECPDWSPEKVCGQGLHGLLWGAGDAALVDRNGIGMVLEVDPADVVELGGKVKFPRCKIVFVGMVHEAATRLAEWAGRTVHFAKVTAGDRGTATAGDCGTATAGYGGTATAGLRGTLVIAWFDGSRRRLAVGYVGEDGILPNVAYKLDRDSFESAKLTTGEFNEP